MRATLVAVTVVVLLASVPVVPASTGTGGSVGVVLGYWAVGDWDVWYYDVPVGAGITYVDLSWAASKVPTAQVDYDVTVWRGDALDDQALDLSERIAWSWTRAWTPRTESIAVNLAPGQYIITVEPVQALGERYTLSAQPGWLTATFSVVPGIKQM